VRAVCVVCALVQQNADDVVAGQREERGAAEEKVEEEEQKVRLVRVPDARVYPGAVVVHLQHALRTRRRKYEVRKQGNTLGCSVKFKSTVSTPASLYTGMQYV
jgi:hypothetical protein